MEGLGGDGPVFVFFCCLFVVFVDGVEFVYGDFFLELVEVEHSDFNGSFCALVGAVGRLGLSFFVNCVEFAHFQQHSVLFIYFILLDVVMKFFFFGYLPVFVFSQVVLGVVFGQHGSFSFFFEGSHRALSGEGSIFFS